jgi:8-oxo-dGTP pyrophosphatase MutT (NUDIX family)
LPLRGDRICLVSSRGGKRWVIPKGRMEAGRTVGQIALQEAWEEAGLTGYLEPAPVGTYRYEKAGSLYVVTVLVMHVTEAAPTWPEAEQRRRVWVPEEKAPLYVDNEGLEGLMRRALPATVR